MLKKMILLEAQIVTVSDGPTPFRERFRAARAGFFIQAGLFTTLIGGAYWMGMSSPPHSYMSEILFTLALLAGWVIMMWFSLTTYVSEPAMTVDDVKRLNAKALEKLDAAS